MNLGFCDRLAGHFRGKGADWDDLVQVARAALLLAVRRFDGERGASFHAFAAPTINGELKRHLRDHCWAIRPPRRLQELRAQLRDVGDGMVQRLGRSPSTDELATALEVSSAMVSEAAAVRHAYHLVSLDAANNCSDAHWFDCDAATLELTKERDDEDLLSRLTLRALLAELTPSERQLLLWRFRDDLTQAVIARRLGVSQMGVSRLLTRLLGRLRDALAIDDTRTAA